MTEGILFDQVSFGYIPGDLIFQKASFSVPEGEFLVVVGPNGGGKSTLIKLCLGLIKPSSGTIWVLGQKPGHSPLLGYVPQNVQEGLSMPITASQVVSMGRLGQKKDPLAVGRALEALGISDLASKPVASLSQGQRQKILIARALASEPRILLMDEPLASVDPESRQSVFKCLKEASVGRTVVIVSHDYSIIPSCASAVACVDRGIYYHGKGELTEEILTRVSASCPVEVIGHGLPHRVLGAHR